MFIKSVIVANISWIILFIIFLNLSNFFAIIIFLHSIQVLYLFLTHFLILQYELQYSKCSNLK